QSEMLNQLENFLIDTAIKKGKQIVLIIDEGQKMGAEQIEVIRTLLNFETNSRKLIQVVIFAQPEFKEVIDAHENFKDRIAFGARIPPLDREDTILFVDFRVNEAGYEGEKPLFSQEAKEMIFQHTGGYPRKIVNMCHHLIVDMLVYNNKVVDGAAVLSRINSDENNYAG
ncbi:MAG: AAA family ATPase, partial [Candidatus Marinimicrobia bacterium]|nr:AAA family ATPase [Candidatus Neomarinimicrobiota bacterium]